MMEKPGGTGEGIPWLLGSAFRWTVTFGVGRIPQRGFQWVQSVDRSEQNFPSSQTNLGISDGF
jgi:hypothetical protein